MRRMMPGLVAAAIVTLVAAPLSAQEGVLGVPMTRSGSGTSWLPDAAPMHAAHATAGAWTIMTHGVAFLQYDKQNGPRGSDQLGSVNWGMLMASRTVGSGNLALKGMISLDPFTVGNSGYPLLLQSGESYRGVPLVDRQHPHDLFMEVAAQYERPIAENIALSLYVAPVGEPALGPVAFPHRASASSDPFAPISHHWQDATHIAFGTLTAGVFTKTLRLEGSVFNGREPDEARTTFDYAGRSLDSYSGRVTWNPTANWSFSGSFGYLKSPEGLHADESTHRVVGSAAYARALTDDATLTATAVYGANRHAGESESSPSYLIEGNLDFRARHSVFARAEHVRKETAELLLAGVEEESANISQITVGYAIDLNRTGPARIGLGVRGTVNIVPSFLEAAYGSRTPTGFAVYLRLRPPPMPAMQMDHSMHTMPMTTGGTANKQ